MLGNKFNCYFNILSTTNRGEGFSEIETEIVEVGLYGYLARQDSTRFNSSSKKVKTRYTHKLYIADEISLEEDGDYIIKVIESYVDDKIVGEYVAVEIDTTPNNKHRSVVIKLDSQSTNVV